MVMNTHACMHMSFNRLTKIMEKNVFTLTHGQMERTKNGWEIKFFITHSLKGDENLFRK